MFFSYRNSTNLLFSYKENFLSPKVLQNRTGSSTKSRLQYPLPHLGVTTTHGPPPPSSPADR